MLARVNRVVTAGDYRSTVRAGRKITSLHAAVYFRFQPNTNLPSRFGFIVAKTVGIAVKRNQLRRRLKSICVSQLAKTPVGLDIVIRMLPGAAQITWSTLEDEISVLLMRGMAKL